MNLTAMSIAALATLPAAALVAWVRFVMQEVEDELDEFSGLRDHPG